MMERMSGKQIAIQRDRLRCLLLLRLRLLLFLEFLKKVWQTRSVFRREVILLAKIQIIPQPFLIGGLERVSP
jgi:hypothetical protein